MTDFTATASIMINSSNAEVWDALTNPEQIKKYLFGTTVETDWQEGSLIVYKGEWNGTSYEDKGKILKVEPEKLLQSTYWSSMSQTEDKEENYATVTYTLEQNGGQVFLTVTQTNNQSQESAEHSQKNWTMVLESLKSLLE